MTYRYADGTTHEDRIRKRLQPSSLGKPDAIVGSGPTRIATQVHKSSTQHGAVANPAMPKGKDLIGAFGPDVKGRR